MAEQDDDTTTWQRAARRAIHERHQNDAVSGIVYALVAMVLVQGKAARELTRIRKLMEEGNTPPPGPVASLGTAVTLVNKVTQGGGMDLGTFNPLDNQDALIELNPEDVNGNPVAIPNGLAWSESSQAAAGSFQMTPKGARFVTNPGNISTQITVATADGSVSDTFKVERGGTPPGDVADLGTTVTLVDKVGAAGRRR